MPGIVSMSIDIFDGLTDGQQKELKPFNFLCYVGQIEEGSVLVKPD